MGLFVSLALMKAKALLWKETDMQEEVFSFPFTSRTSLVCNQGRKIALL